MDESLSDNSKYLMDYAESTKLTCIYTGIVIILILIFMVSPLRGIIGSPFLVNSVIVLLLGYIILKNIINTYALKESYNIDFSTSDWSKIKTAIIGGYVFSLFIVFLQMAVLRNIFFSQGQEVTQSQGQAQGQGIMQSINPF